MLGSMLSHASKMIQTRYRFVSHSASCVSKLHHYFVVLIVYGTTSVHNVQHSCLHSVSVHHICSFASKRAGSHSRGSLLKAA